MDDVIKILYVSFWLIIWRKNFYADVSEHSICSIFIGRYLPMKMEQIECSETSAYKILTPGNYPEENIQHS